MKSALPRWTAALAAVMFLHGSAAAAPREWTLQVATGPVYASLDESRSFAQVSAVTVSAPLRPWFLAGAELDWYGIRGQGGRTTLGELVYAKRSDALALLASFRMQVPVRQGLAPFLVVTSGLAGAHWGATREMASIQPLSVGTTIFDRSDSRYELAWVTSAGVGVRAVLPGRWPDLEGSARKVAWLGDRTMTQVEPRLALAW